MIFEINITKFETLISLTGVRELSEELIFTKKKKAEGSGFGSGQRESLNLLLYLII